MSIKIQDNNRYKPRYKKNSCGWCGCTNDRYPKVICSACENLRKERQRVLREKRKSNGECIDCGSLAVPNRVRCARCIRKQNEARIKYKKKYVVSTRKG